MGVRDVYMKTLMSSNYKKDIFYTKEQVLKQGRIIVNIISLVCKIEEAVTSAYPDIDTEIVADYKGEALHRVLRCCYDNLSGEIVLPCTVIMDYITPANSIEELVFLSRSDISRSKKAY